MGSSLLLAVPFVLMKKTSSNDKACVGDNLNSCYQQLSEKISQTSPMEFLIEHADYVAVGLISGFTAGLLGVGGGIISTTYMSSFTEMSQIDAVATSLLALVPTGLYTSFWQLRAGNVNSQKTA